MTEVIELICQKLGIVFENIGNMAEEQLIPYLQTLMIQLANGKFAFWLTLAIIFGILLIASIIGICYLIKSDDGDDETLGVCLIVLSILFLILIIISICYAVQWATMPDIMAWRWITETLK